MRRTWARLLEALQEIARIDLRALGLYRIGLGLVLFFDFIYKAVDLTAFYTDQGILPRSLVVQNGAWWDFSFHLASGSYWFQAALMSVGLALSIALTLGYRTRIVTVLLWIFVVSLQERNTLILHAGDALMRVMLFWSMFLPLQARYSLDRFLAPSPDPRFESGRIQSMASLALLLQLLVMYMATALMKNHPEWNRDFLAVYYALSLKQFTTPLGHALLDFPTLLKVLTFVTFYLELIGPYLLIIPFVQKPARWVVPFLFMGLHFSFFLTMNLGLFPWICLICWILFLPGPLFDALERGLLGAQRCVPTRFEPRATSHITPTFGLTNTFITLCLVVMGVWNFHTLEMNKPFQVPPLVRNFALALRLDQNWNMFAPYPLRSDGWFVVDGRLANGEEFDPWNKQKPNSQQPRSFMQSLRSTPWRKYLTNVWVLGPSNEQTQLAFGRYICREWNTLQGPRPPDRRLVNYDLYYVRKKTPPPGEWSIFKRVLLWSHSCSKPPLRNVATSAPSQR